MPLALLSDAHSASAQLLLVLAGMWLLAKVGGEACHRLRLPRVVGELGAGLAIAILVKLSPGAIPHPADIPAMEPIAEIGIVVLMFEVGLESTISQMLRVGLPAFRVAVFGVAMPMALGFGAGQLLLPDGSSWVLSLFVGACLSATSIGITAQVLGERGALNTPEGRVIVGAAVLDDIIGLLVLVVVTGFAGAATTGAGLPWGPLVKTLAYALGFLTLALVAGHYLTPHLFRLADRFRSEQLLLPLGLGFAFLLAGLGNLAGLATIVGAYAAGLILEPAMIKSLEEREAHKLVDLLHPLVVSLSPIFFVLMGSKVDPAALIDPKALFLMAVLTVLGVAGKFAAGFGGNKGMRTAVIGWGMVPRGEVGLIFVAVGSSLTLGGKPLLDPVLQAGIVGAILLTTIIGPIGLGVALRAKAPAH